MTSLRRILKMLLAFVTGQGVSIFTQLVILHSFCCVSRMARWSMESGSRSLQRSLIWDR